MRRFLLAVVLTVLSAATALCHEDKPKDGTPPVQVANAAPSGIEGRVVFRDEGVKDAFVYAYRTYDELNGNKPFAVSRPTADDGTFKMDLPPGEKILFVAKKRAAGSEDGPLAEGDLGAFHGSNPITVAPGAYLHVGFSTVKQGKPPTYTDGEDPASGSIEGVATFQGEPLEGVRVSIFLLQEGDFRGLGFADSPPSRKSGKFRFEYLPETKYYMVARKRTSGQGAGPMKDGDFYGYFLANPVEVHAGKVTHVEFELVNKAAEIGKEDSLFRDTGTQLKGRILDKEGKPVKGVYAFAYVDKVMAHKRPESISREVDAEGRYTIFLPTGGVYYIGARSSYGDSPGVGEWYGRYDGSPDHSVKVETGKSLTGVDVVVEKILQ